MPKFIELTATTNGKEVKKVFVNVDHIIYFRPFTKKSPNSAHNAYIVLTEHDGERIDHVAETAEQIQELLNK